jgi:sugar O-acyltransferase (sialic acid O-acetyltransferase NeuD family)
VAEVVIFGTGDIARLAHLYFSSDSQHRVVAFTVDVEFLDRETFQALPVVGFDTVTDRYPPNEFGMFIALSYARMNRLRAEKFAAARMLKYELVTYVSSRCTYLSEHPPGDNCFILEDNTIQPGARIGHNVTLWSGNHIGHDATIADHCFVSSHVVVSGWVRVASYCFLGVNATLRNSISLAPRTLVGAGAVVLADTTEGSVYVPPRATVLDRDSDELAL